MFNNVFQIYLALHTTGLVLFSSLGPVALSLCGALQDAERNVADERFLKHVITYESFCDNPNLLTDPKLVVQFDGK